MTYQMNVMFPVLASQNLIFTSIYSQLCLVSIRFSNISFLDFAKFEALTSNHGICVKCLGIKMF